MKINSKNKSLGFLLVVILSFGFTHSVFAVDGWVERTNSPFGPISIASSSDGTKLAATVFGGYIYTSTDSGATWTEQTNSGQRNWNSIASSSDGTKLISGDTGGYIYTSTDSGATWTEQTNSGTHSWYDFASSSDGAKLAATDSNTGYIYTSTDSGATWTEQTNSGQRAWNSIASSSDGSILIASPNNGSNNIYTSTDSGVNWTVETGAPGASWYGVAMSSDGASFAGAATDTYVYTYGVLTAPTLSTSAASNTGKTYTTLNGDITDIGDRTVTTRGFEYGLTTGYGTTVSTSGSYSTGSFSSSIILSLTCDTTYHYRAYATSTAGTSYGSDSTFTTTDCSTVDPEVVTTGSATAGLVHATLNETITNVDSGNATERGFNYGLTNSYGTTKSIPGDSDFGLGDYSSIVAPLTCGTTYHYRAYIIHPTGVGYGDDATFTTEICPVIESNQILYAVDGSGSNNTPILYKLDPESGSKIETIGEVGFNVTGLAFHPITGVLYGSTGGQGNSTKSLITINTTTGAGTLLGAIKTSGNSARVMPDIAFKSDGTLYGFSGTDNSLHIIDISSCNGTTCTTAQVGNTDLSGAGYGLAFNSNDELYVFWDYDNAFDQLDPDTGLSIDSIDFSNPSGEHYPMSAAAFDANNVLYASRINYGSSPSDLVTVDVSTGEITSFGDNSDMIYMDALAFYTAPVVSPTVATISATSVSNSSVVLTGNITRGGYAANTVRGFEYGLTTSYGSVVSETGTLRIGEFSLSATGLTCGTQYHYRAYSTNSEGTGTGSDTTFTTSACPSTTTSGSSAGSRASNLISMGKVDEAQQILNQYPNAVTQLQNTSVPPTVTPPTPNKVNTQSITSRLSKGTNNTQVQTLQEFLNTLGYNLKLDGKFGPQTEQVVKIFQASKNLTPDGIVGPITRNIILKLLSGNE